jgi:hypothetical protein
MRKEWEWRVSRGESLRNLEAFRGILARPGDPDAGSAPAPEPATEPAPAPAAPGSAPT